MSTKKTKATADQLARLAPAGWTVTRGAGWTDGVQAFSDQPFYSTFEWVRFERDCAVVALNVTAPVDSWNRKRAYKGSTVEGHTLVDGCSFTRRGVDVSSCDLVTDEKERYGSHSYGDLGALLAGEYERCLAAKARRATSVSVPGLPFSVQPEWFERSAKTLREGGLVRLLPAGFGTGYTLSARAGYLGTSARAKAELEKRLGVSPVFVMAFDHD